MRIWKTLAASVFLGVLCLAQEAPAPAPAQPADPPETATATLPPATDARNLNTNPKANVTAGQLTQAEIEHFLETANIIAERAAEKGITKTKRITLTDGHWIHDGHVQTIDLYKAEYHTKEGVQHNFRDSYKFNIAAYKLAKIMGLDNMPPYVYRVVKGQPASVSWWVDDVQFDEEGRRAKSVDPPDLNYWTRQLNEVRAFDELIYNEDRNQGNLLIDQNWKLWMIDHTRSFRDNLTLRNPGALKRISPKMLSAIRNLNQQVLEQNLLPFVTKQDIAALLTRRDLIVKHFETEIRSKGSDAVLMEMPLHTPRVTIP